MNKPTLLPIYNHERLSSISKSTSSSKDGDQKTIDPLSAWREELLITDSEEEDFSDSEEVTLENDNIVGRTFTKESFSTNCSPMLSNNSNEVFIQEGQLKQGDLPASKVEDCQKFNYPSKKGKRIEVNLYLESPSQSNSISISPEQMALQQSWLSNYEGVGKKYFKQCPSVLEQINQVSCEDECLSTLQDDSFTMPELNKAEKFGRRQAINISILSDPLLTTEQELNDQEKAKRFAKGSQTRFAHVLSSSKRREWKHCSTATNGNPLQQKDHMAQVLNLIKAPPRKTTVNGARLQQLKDRMGSEFNSSFQQLNIQGTSYPRYTNERLRLFF